MKQFYRGTLVLLIFFGLGKTTDAQDFSNKGKEFWLAYSYHVGMAQGGNPTMTLYLSCDVITTYQVEIWGGAVLSTGTIPANGVISVVIPTAYFINGDGSFIGRTIHVTAAKPIVVYSFITRSQASAASLCLPTNVLGREYYASSFTNNSNENNSCSYITIVAIEDNTTVEVTVTAATRGGWAGGSTNVISLNKGQVYQILGETSGTSGVDLSGSKIKSISTGSGCKKIAVFSGTGKVFIQSPGCSQQSSDNLYQQLYPVASWGKRFLTVPSYSRPNNYYRIYRSVAATNVYVNGALIPAGSFINNYYEFINNTPNIIDADNPISVVQYFTTQNCPGNPQPYDPEMIILSPLEQNIKNVTLVNTPLTVGGAHQHHIHIVMKNTGTAISSFTFDGGAPPGTWQIHPEDPNYSYLYLNNVAVGNHRLASDSGFNAVAYGYGNAETYGYNAGANVRDLYTSMGFNTPYGHASAPLVCVGSGSRFKMSLPYLADSIFWQISQLPGSPPDTMTRYPPSTPDSITVVNGRNVYWYSLPSYYLFNTAGTYPVTITVFAQNADGCGSEQDYDFEVEVFPLPIADFTFTTNGCATSPVQFTDNSNTSGRPVSSRYWNFGDGNSTTINNPTHTYGGAGVYNVGYTIINDIGCKSDTTFHPVTLDAPPVAQFVTSGPYCINQPVTFTDQSTPGNTITKWTWNFGDGSPPVVVLYPNPPNQTHAYTTAGTYNATLQVETGGGCTSLIATIPVTIEQDGTISLTSAPGTNNQTVCINTAITTITYAVGGSSNGGTVTGLPAGVTGSFAGGVITISGTPTASGTFNYTVNTTGPCVNPTATGTIIVNPNTTLTLTSAPGSDNQTVCINTPIINVTYSVGGSGTGASVAGLPAGVSGVFSGGVITISGSPTIAGTFNYTVNSTGPCVNPTVTGTIIVTADGTLTLTSAPGSDNQTVCINTPITPITYAVGGSATGATVAGLPAGVNGNFAGGIMTISGTPSVSGTFNFTVNGSGPCGSPSASGTILVNPDGTLSLTSGAGTDNQTACVNNPIITITYAVGGSGNGGSVTGLPAGVNAVFAAGVITISGSPAVTGVFNYTVTTTGPCVNPTAAGTITVTSNATISLTSPPGSDNQTVCINTAIADITYLVGGSATGGTVTGLPTGVTSNLAGGVITISGTPTVSGTFNYTVSTTGPCGTPTATGTITVNPNTSLTLTSAPSTTNQSVCINTAITAITYSIGGSGTGATVTGLPAGVNGVFSGGVMTISGSPTVTGVYSYTINTTGPCVNPTATGTITVTADATLTLTSPPGSDNQTVCINTAIANITYSIAGSATSASVTGLPAGVTGNYSGGVVTISGTPAVSGTFNFTVNTTGPCGTPGATGTITVNPNTSLTLASAPGTNNQSVCINTAITTITYSVGGSGTGASVTGLPAGLNGVFSGGVMTISGSPTVTGVYNYTINSTGPCVNPTAAGTITVTADATLTRTSAPGTDNQTVCINTAITNITYAVAGSASSASVTGLPAGVTGNYSGGVVTISGTPTVSGTFNFTVSTTGPCGTPTATGTILVNDNSTLTLTSGSGSNVQTGCINRAINNITYAIGGGGNGASITAGSLPAGVNGVYSGGVYTISGTPTVSGTFNFTVGTSGPCNNTAQSGTITVTPDATLTMTSAPGTNNQTVCINTAISSINYAIGGSGTGAFITAGSLPPGVNAVYSGGVFTISGTPTISGTYNFTIGTAGPCTNPSLTGSLTVNPDHAINLSSAASTTNQTVCSDNAIASIAYTLSGGATGATVTGLPPGVTSSVSGSTLTISGNPTIAGSYNYSINTTGNSCIRTTASGSISVLQTPAIQFDPVPGVCADVTSFQVTASPANGTFSGPGINATGLFDPATAGPGNHIIRYTFTAANGCTNYKEQVLAVYPKPGVNAGPDKFVLEGGTIQLTPAANAGVPVTYSWSPTQYLNNPNISNPLVINPQSDMTYTLTVTTANGCSSSDNVFVKLLKAVVIPNIFSPNGDGIHDKWVIEYLESYPGATVDIYNRYGQHVYRKIGYTTPWDGTVNGKPVPVGTYYYVIDPKNGRKVIAGYVDVIR